MDDIIYDKHFILLTCFLSVSDQPDQRGTLQKLNPKWSPKQCSEQDQ